jgi:hydrogenase expression/formation protein HypD
MRFIDEYRDAGAVRRVAEAIAKATTRPWTIMEICGGQTNTIARHGLEAMLPDLITLVHGPGCPVCVTPLEMIDRAIAIAMRPEVVLTSFGDMLRVPGSSRDLLSVKAERRDVQVVYSPLDAVRLAEREPRRQVVFFAVGFETTAPANAMAVREAKRRRLRNFSILCSNVLVPPAIEAILSSPGNRVQGFLAAGHVCAVMGYEEYFGLAARYRTPMVVTGFEPLDILQGVAMTVRQLEEHRHDVENQYSRVVRREGNPHAREIIADVFETTDRKWRGIGVIPRSGLRLKEAYADFDAERRFQVGDLSSEESHVCIAGQVLQGLRKPPECPAFAKECTPEHPLGAPMVSSEGACAAYYHFRRHHTPQAMPDRRK